MSREQFRFVRARREEAVPCVCSVWSSRIENWGIPTVRDVSCGCVVIPKWSEESVICMKDALLLTRGIAWSEAVECVKTRRIGCVSTSSSTNEMRCVRSSSRRSGSASVESTI